VPWEKERQENTARGFIDVNISGQMSGYETLMI
jgi:hypothetical protein